MRQDDLLPQGLRLMTRDGLRFVASYRGLMDLSDKLATAGGPVAELWRNAARQARHALENEALDGATAVEAFERAARQEGWSVRGTERWPASEVVRRPPPHSQPAALRI
jgi:hypothetical protein